MYYKQKKNIKFQGAGGGEPQWNEDRVQRCSLNSRAECINAMRTSTIRWWI